MALSGSWNFSGAYSRFLGFSSIGCQFGVRLRLFKKLPKKIKFREAFYTRFLGFFATGALDWSIRDEIEVN